MGVCVCVCVCGWVCVGVGAGGGSADSSVSGQCAGVRVRDVCGVSGGTSALTVGGDRATRRL